MARLRSSVGDEVCASSCGASWRGWWGCPPAPGLVGAGLDDAMNQADAFPPELVVDKRMASGDKADRRSKRSVGRMLNERAESYESGWEEERRRRRKRKKKTEGADKKKQSRGDPGASMSSEDECGSSSSDQPFQKLSEQSWMSDVHQEPIAPRKAELRAARFRSSFMDS